MAFSEHHCFIVTTVASVARLQDLNYAIDVLSQMMLHNTAGTQAYSIQRSRLYETKPEHPCRSLTMLVRNSCLDNLCQTFQSNIEVSDKVDNSWTRIMFGTDSNESHRNNKAKAPGSRGESSPNPFFREPVYDTKAEYFRRMSGEAKQRGRTISHGVLKWLLGVPIEPFPDTGLLAFRTLRYKEANSHSSMIAKT